MMPQQNDEKQPPLSMKQGGWQSRPWNKAHPRTMLLLRQEIGLVWCMFPRQGKRVEAPSTGVFLSLCAAMCMQQSATAAAEITLLLESNESP